MPAFLAMVLGGLINITGTIAGRVLVALGIGVVTYSGVTSSLSFLKDQAVGNLQGLPLDVLAMLSLLKVGVSISIITSAIVARAVITGINNDSVKKWVLK